ncbi:MAG: alpha/beta hydrolase [Pseudomonadota bacterium]
MFTRIAFIVAALCLSGCATEFRGDWRPYVGNDNDLCLQGPYAATPNAKQSQFFVTSRLPDCRTAEFMLTDQRGDKIRYGRLGADWTNDDADILDIAFMGHTAWEAELSKAARNNKGTVLVYIHGFNNTAYEVAEAAHGIANVTGYKGPVISYHWPSRAQVISYAVDEANRNWDNLYLTRVLANIAQLRDVKRIILVAHSMGSRGAIAALNTMDTQHAWLSGKFETIIIAAGDIDRQYFEQQLRDVVLTREKAQQGRHFVAYVSGKDIPVRISRRLHLYERMGYTGCINADKLPPCYVEPVWPAIVDDKGRMRGAETVRGLRIYDTTAIEESFLGHSDYRCVPVAIETLREAIFNPESLRNQSYEVIPLEPDGRDGVCD